MNAPDALHSALLDAVPRNCPKRRITLAQKYFKGIGSHLVNADEVHLTGTGTIQQQFKHYLADTPQFKKTVVSESTSNAMR